MEAKVYNLAQWKAAHPPALICWQHGLQAALARQQLLLKIAYSSFRR